MGAFLCCLGQFCTTNAFTHLKISIFGRGSSDCGTSYERHIAWQTLDEALKYDIIKIGD